MDCLLTQRDAALAIRCSTRTLERLRLSGLGPRYVKTTRKILYSRVILKRGSPLERCGVRAKL